MADVSFSRGYTVGEQRNAGMPGNTANASAAANFDSRVPPSTLSSASITDSRISSSNTNRAAYGQAEEEMCTNAEKAAKAFQLETDDEDDHDIADDDDDDDDDPFLLTKQDIWLEILSFVGPGHFAYVAGVSCQFKKLYRSYFSTLEQTAIPDVQMTQWHSHGLNGYKSHLQNSKRKATVTDTFYSVVDSSTSCAQFWWYNYHVVTSIPSNNSRLPKRLISQQHVYGLLWDKGSCREAPRDHGHLNRHSPEYLYHDNDVFRPWDFWASSVAAFKRHFDCLQYALWNGCHWDSYAINVKTGNQTTTTQEITQQ